MARASIKKNYIYNLTYQILLLLTPLITTPYVSRVLGADGVGTYSRTAAVVTYFVMVETLGTYHYGQREVSYVQNDEHKRSLVFWNLVVFRMVNTVIFILLFLAFILTRQRDGAVYAMLMCSIVEVGFDITWFFQGMEDFGRVVRRNIVIKLISIACVFLLVREKSDLIIYVACIVATSLLGNISLWAFVPKYIHRVSVKELRPWKGMRNIIALFIPTVAIDIYTVLDKVMIGWFTVDSFENGYYEQALKLSRMVLTVVTSLGTVMIPRIGHYFAENDKVMIRKSMNRSYNFVWFMSIPMCLGIFCVSDNLVPWFFGPGYEKVAMLLKISCLLIPAIGISNVTGRQYMIPTMKQNYYTVSVCIGAGLNVVLNLLLIPKLFSVGAVIASVSAEVVIAGIQLFFVRRELPAWDILRLSPHYLIAGTLMTAVLLAENHRMSSSIVNTCLMVLTGIAVYFVILLILRDEFMLTYLRQTLTQVLNKIRRKRS